MQLKPVSRRLQLIENKGKLAERQLLARWRQELGAFAACFDEIVRQRHCALEIGLEPELSLKFVIKRGAFPPATGLLRLKPDLKEPVAGLAEYALKHRLEFHVGIKAQPDKLAREIYVYCRPYSAFREILDMFDIPHPEPDMEVAFFGVDENGSVSAYYASPDTPAIQHSTRLLREKLEAELRTPISDWLVGHWEHLRFVEGAWHPAKIGLEFSDPPAELVTRVLSHYRPPWFRYLVPRRQLLQMAVAHNPEQNRPAWYFTVY